MGMKYWLNASVAAAALAVLAAPNAAFAQSSGPQAMEERIRAMEAELAAMRAELEALRTMETETRDDVIRLRDAPPVSQPQGPTPPREGFLVGQTTFRISGFVKADALLTDYSGGDAPAGVARDFYLPSATPVGGVSEDDPSLDLHGKQTRFALTATRAAEGHTLSAYIEADFQTAPGTQGSEVATNGYNFAMRRAYISYDNWLFGQDWSTFQNVNVLPESTDFIGPSEGTVFVRQPQVRYTLRLGEHTNMQFSVENPETNLITLGAVDDDGLPDIVGRWNYTNGPTVFSVAVMGRQLNVESGATNDEATGWGVSVAGKLGLGANNDIRGMITTGEGIGRYVGLGFAADGVVAGGEIQASEVTAGFVSFRHVWSPRLRSSLTYSMIDADYDVLLPTQSESAWSAAANLFFEPTPGLLLGAEYRHAERELFNGQSGELDRLHFIAKQSF
jgi:hypothetical protein